MKTISGLLLLVVLFSSCASMPEGAGYDSEVAGGSERRVRRSGSMEMRSRTLEDSAKKCVALVRTHRGTMDAATLTENDYQATIRVPAESLEPLMDSLAGAGRVTSRQVSAEDVTAAYQDLEAEVRNVRALRDRLRQLLGKATTVKDTLAIEKELARVQAELDKLEGRLVLLRSQVVRSTLQLSIERERTPGPLGAVVQGTGWTVKKLFVLD